MRLPPLNAIRAFEATARHLSFSKAAEELNLTPSALSYQVRMLEDHLGMKVFKRLNRAIELTETGARLFPGIRDGFDRLRESFDQLTPDTPDDVLVVSTGPAFAAKWLTPRVFRFVDAHPDIELRISANLRLVDFGQNDIDVGLRFGEGRYPGLRSERVLPDFATPMASPRFLEQHPDLKAPFDLQAMPLLHDDSLVNWDHAPSWGLLFRRLGLDEARARRGLRFNHADHALDAAVEGAGVVLGRNTLAAGDIRTGRLVRLFPELVLDTHLSFHLVCREQDFSRHKIRVFWDWVLAEAARPDSQLGVAGQTDAPGPDQDNARSRNTM
ncbi:MAG: transcriptional regulator GcvA [Pseudomonadota bacterium]